MASADRHNRKWAVVVDTLSVGGALLTAAYAFRMLALGFRAGGMTPALRPVPLVMEMMTLVLALLAILIGLRVQEPLRLIEPIADPAGMEEEVGR